MKVLIEVPKSKSKPNYDLILRKQGLKQSNTRFSYGKIVSG